MNDAQFRAMLWSLGLGTALLLLLIDRYGILPLIVIERQMELVVSIIGGLIVLVIFVLVSLRREGGRGYDEKDGE